MSALDYEAWRCTSRDTFGGNEGISVFCPKGGCPAYEVVEGKTIKAGCARDRGWTPERQMADTSKEAGE